uniref:Uncharacterized protein n=1 Tax=Alexandrium monilatum TaxID=311494 RepID=A0A7S4UTU5_9DINO|mmetsp:Transcript_48425/g.144642  ORF Transcript_48425/g.144642 Transcript_48425/m.144642 type:complete len:428 (-) Transcript_48425:46-1329(-)
MQGLPVNVPLGGGRRVPGMLYAPALGIRVVGIVIMAPGSNGGTGPGLELGREGLPLHKSQSTAAFGSIYRRLGCELADPGAVYDWRGNAPEPSPGGRHAPPAVAVLHISWRYTHSGKKWPKGKLKLVSSLQVAANDFLAAVSFMRDTYGPQLPVVLVGFSFGGPAAWAAAGKLTAEGVPPEGVVALAGSGRDGSAFRELGLDTLGCMLRCSQAGVAALLLHGTADENVAVEVAQYFYSALLGYVCAGSGTSAATLAVVAGSAHMFNLARDIAFSALKQWTLACIRGGGDGSCVPPCGPQPAAVQIRSGGRAEPFPVGGISRGLLLRSDVKGYSEREVEGQDCQDETPDCSPAPPNDYSPEPPLESRRRPRSASQRQHLVRPLSKPGRRPPSCIPLAEQSPRKRTPRPRVPRPERPATRCDLEPPRGR